MKLIDKECEGIRSKGRWRANSVLTRSKFTTIIAYSFIRGYIGKQFPGSSLFSKGSNEEFDNLCHLIREFVINTEWWTPGQNNVNYLDFLKQCKELYDGNNDKTIGYAAVSEKIQKYLNENHLDETIVPVRYDDEKPPCNSIHVFSMKKAIDVDNQHRNDNYGLTNNYYQYVLNMIYLSSAVSIDDDGRSLFISTSVSNNNFRNREVENQIMQITILFVGYYRTFDGFFNHNERDTVFFNERSLEMGNRVYRCVYCSMDVIEKFSKDDFDIGMVGSIKKSDFKKLQNYEEAIGREFVEYESCLKGVMGVDYDDVASVVYSFVDHSIETLGIQPYVIH